MATETKEKETPNKEDSKRGGSSQGGGRARNQRKNTRKPRRDKRRRPRSEYDQKIIDIRRVTRVVAGGRRFSFSVAMVVGDRKGKVGVGVGKATDTALAIEKAARDGKKNMIELTLTDDMTLPHEVEAKYNASIVKMQPAPGRGLVAGSSVRNVLEIGGVKNVSSKLLSRSKNKLNNARAAIEALKKVSK